MAELLRAHGFAAFGVDSAAACLELLDREAMDVVVTDVAMPDMSGIELCHELRARNPAPRILVMSGYDSCADIAAARQPGALAYLVKPGAPRRSLARSGAPSEPPRWGLTPSGLATRATGSPPHIAPPPMYADRR